MALVRPHPPPSVSVPWNATSTSSPPGCAFSWAAGTSPAGTPRAAVWVQLVGWLLQQTGACDPSQSSHLPLATNGRRSGLRGGIPLPREFGDFVLPLILCPQGWVCSAGAAVLALLLPVWGHEGTRGDRSGTALPAAPVCAVPCPLQAQHRGFPLNRGAPWQELISPQPVAMAPRGPGLWFLPGWLGWARDARGGCSRVSGSKQRVWEVCHAACVPREPGGCPGRGTAGTPGHGRSEPGAQGWQCRGAGSARGAHPAAGTGCDTAVSPRERQSRTRRRGSAALLCFGADFHNRNPEQRSQRAGGDGRGKGGSWSGPRWDNIGRMLPERQGESNKCRRAEELQPNPAGSRADLRPGQPRAGWAELGGHTSCPHLRGLLQLSPGQCQLAQSTVNKAGPGCSRGQPCQGSSSSAELTPVPAPAVPPWAGAAGSEGWRVHAAPPAQGQGGSELSMRLFHLKNCRVPARDAGGPSQRDESSGPKGKAPKEPPRPCWGEQGMQAQNKTRGLGLWSLCDRLGQVLCLSRCEGRRSWGRAPWLPAHGNSPGSNGSSPSDAAVRSSLSFKHSWK